MQTTSCGRTARRPARTPQPPPTTTRKRTHTMLKTCIALRRCATPAGTGNEPTPEPRAEGATFDRRRRAETPADFRRSHGNGHVTLKAEPSSRATIVPSPSRSMSSKMACNPSCRVQEERGGGGEQFNQWTIPPFGSSGVYCTHAMSFTATYAWCRVRLRPARVTAWRSRRVAHQKKERVKVREQFSEQFRGRGTSFNVFADLASVEVQLR